MARTSPQVGRNHQASRAQRRADIRDRLRIAVEDLMADDQSYTALSVERIVKEAQISRATFYVYFEDKGDLLRALAEDFIERILVAASAWWELPPGATKSDLRAAMRSIFNAYLPHKVVMAAVVEVASYDAPLRTLFGDLLDRTIGAVADHIATGQSAGFVAPELDPLRTAAWLTWMAERGLYQLVASADEDRSERLLDAITDITWNTLYAQAVAA
jgi:TetR/AcrR family transcriptional regulator, ethionamide resistance regulator